VQTQPASTRRPGRRARPACSCRGWSPGLRTVWRSPSLRTARYTAARMNAHAIFSEDVRMGL